MECNLVVVHGDVELVVQLESHAPDDPPEPQAVVGVHRLGLGGDVQDEEVGGGREQEEEVGSSRGRRR